MQNPKKSKTDAEGLNSFFIKSHSPILSQPFPQNNSEFFGYLYQVTIADQFGIFLPLEFPKNPYITYINKYSLTCKAIEMLQDFQHEMWSDLFKSSKEPIGSLSEANYFVVPLIGNDIDWTAVKRALRIEGLLKLKDFLISSRNNLILRTGYKNNATWKYLSEINSSTTSKEFLEGLLGRLHENLNFLLEKYAGYDPIDILLDESFKNQSLQGFRNFLKNSGFVLDENSILVFAKQTKSIKHQPSVHKISQELYPNGTPILLSNLVSVFYLNSTQWGQSRNLLLSLIQIENFSYFLEFSEIFQYSGNFLLLKEACQSPGLDSTCNYESMETLGDTVLKIVYTLHIYLNNEELNEFRLTRKRGWKVSNRFLTRIAVSYDLKRFLKTKSMKTNSFRPAFYLSKVLPNETSMIEQKVSDGMLADFIEALIGAFYLSSGLKSAGEFMLKLGIFSLEGWQLTSAYLSDNDLSVLSPVNLVDFPTSPFKISNLLPIPNQSSVSSILNYDFQNEFLLQQSLTHHTLDSDFNYERLEFLGDAVVDLIVLTNIWKLQKFDPDFLTYFKHELVNNNTLAKISFASGLYKFMKVDEEILKSIRNFYLKYQWDEDLYSEQNVLIDMPKCLGDIFEAVVGAVLIDSQSIEITAIVVGFIFCNLILYMVNGKDRYKKTIVARLCEKVAENGGKIEFKQFTCEDIFLVQVWVNNGLLCEDYGESLKKAKENASLAAYNRIMSESEETSSCEFENH